STRHCCSILSMTHCLTSWRALPPLSLLLLFRSGWRMLCLMPEGRAASVDRSWRPPCAYAPRHTLLLRLVTSAPAIRRAHLSLQTLPAAGTPFLLREAILSSKR